MLGCWLLLCTTTASAVLAVVVMRTPVAPTLALRLAVQPHCGSSGRRAARSTLAA